MGWKDKLQEALDSYFGFSVDIKGYSHVGGGSINDTYRISTSHGNFFVKKNSATSFPEMFQKEVKGINLLGEAKELHVPKVISIDEGGGDSFLILDFIDSGPKTSSFWRVFGEQLAKLHQHSNGIFGLDHDNYIGSLYQRNNQHDNWNDFFRDERLEFQLKMARDSGIIGSDISNAFNRFYKEIDDLFPVEPPALLHGDLWGGNFMVNKNGMPVIIDPAVYYGHREMDLAMTQLFGGFDNEFYQSYNRHFPLELGWEERLNYCNLYPLMVHVNLFGGSYIQSVKAIINRF